MVTLIKLSAERSKDTDISIELKGCTAIDVSEDWRIASSKGSTIVIHDIYETEAKQVNICCESIGFSKRLSVHEVWSKFPGELALIKK